MLQQTQVKTVIPFWERWMQALPTIRSLAEAPPEQIHKLWEGLGYYTRVRNMQQAARDIIARHHGRFPEDFAAILELPGIGRYTAGAIASIAFNQPKPLLDGNVIRVLTRLFGIAENPRDKPTNDQLWHLAGQLVLSANAPRTTSPNACSHLNQSLMELGALVCTPKQPKCLLCPVRPHCEAYRTGRVEQFPNLGPRAAASTRRFIALAIRHRDRFLVRQRPAGVVNGHLWEFPNLEVTDLPKPDARQLAQAHLGFTPKALKPLCTIKHTITRYRITLQVFEGSLPAGHKPRDAQWRTLAQLHLLPFPSAHQRVVRLLTAEPGAGPKRLNLAQVR
jgi:A/G-specific adenine glycosylase